LPQISQRFGHGMQHAPPVSLPAAAATWKRQWLTVRPRLPPELRSHSTIHRRQVGRATVRPRRVVAIGAVHIILAPVLNQQR